MEVVLTMPMEVELQLREAIPDLERLMSSACSA
jgi:hypothetical protein